MYVPANRSEHQRWNASPHRGLPSEFRVAEWGRGDSPASRACINYTQGYVFHYTFTTCGQKGKGYEEKRDHYK